MSIYGQPNSWQCGPFALKHGLLTLGIFTHENELARLAGSSEHGTDEAQLGRAARGHGCDLGLVRCGHGWTARRQLEAHLARGIPVLVCVDQWEHWMTVVGAERDRLVVFDSHYDAPLRFETWERLRQRLGFRVRRLRGMWHRTLYDLHPLIPRRPTALRVAFTPARVEYLLWPENAALAARWDDYARELVPLALPQGAGAQGAQLELALPLDRFLAARRASIVAPAVQGDGAARVRAERVVEGLIFVAGLCGLVLRPEREPEAALRLAGAVRTLCDLPAAKRPEAPEPARPFAVSTA